MAKSETTIPIPTLTQDQKDYIAKLDKANVRPGDPRLQEPLVTPQTTKLLALSKDFRQADRRRTVLLIGWQNARLPHLG